MNDGDRPSSGDLARRAVSRRHFLTAAGLGVAGVAAGPGKAALAAPDAGVVGEAEALPIALTINRHQHRVLVEARWSLAYVLRDKLGLTGTKLGCDRGECGACTVLIDGKPRYSCLTLAVEAQHGSVTTVEGLTDSQGLGPVQKAFRDHDAFQCGYCTPGQMMAAAGLLLRDPNPDLEAIRIGASGNLCRCGAYPNIFRAIRTAARLKRQQGGAR